MTERPAIVLFAHGARDPAWSSPLRELQSALRARGLEARVAFLELQSPRLEDVLDELAPRHPSIRVLPVFWAEAGHVRDALPGLLAAARSRHPAVRFTRLATLSRVPGLIEHLAEYASLDHPPEAPPSDPPGDGAGSGARGP